MSLVIVVILSNPVIIDSTPIKSLVIPFVIQSSPLVISMSKPTINL